MNTQLLHAIVRTFTSYGAPDRHDGSGPNKMDWDFFRRIAEADNVHASDVPEIARRLHKYRNTQLQSVLSDAGLHKEAADPVRWLATLKDNMPTLKSATNVSFSHHEETWTDRWGKPRTSKRIALHYQYNPAFNDALKASLDFPKVKFDGNIKKWTIANERETLNTTIEVLTKQGAVFDASLDVVAGGTGSQPEVRYITEPEAFLRKGVIVMQWPYIRDPHMRAELLDEVRETQGRKFNKAEKSWSISIYEGAPLIERLKKLQGNPWAAKLASAIGAIPEISMAMVERGERIAISSAPVLDEERMTALRTRLSGIFPPGLELYPFQYVGVQFAELAGGRVLIGDDMGIGKTIQAIAYMALNQDKLPALVVCPAGVKMNWVKECRKWLPSLTTEPIKGRGKSPLPKADILVANYDIMAGREPQLKERMFNIVVCDESHYLKNSKAKRTEATLAVASDSEAVLCLSGTAVTNRPSEFFTTLNLLRPMEFPYYRAFSERYCDAYQGDFGWISDGASNTDELHARTRDFTIRRLKSEVLTELPDKVRTIVPVEMTTKMTKEYTTFFRSWKETHISMLDHGSVEPGYVLNMLTSLRHEAGRMKVPIAVDWIREYRAQTGKPLVVFAHHKDVQRGIAHALREDKEHQWRIGGITGGMSPEVREKQVEMFQAGHFDVIICSTLAAKEGITLTAADTTLFVEREWVPGWEEQAEDRVNRIGQESQSISATYLSLSGTIDEHFDAVVEEKRAIVSAVLDGGDVVERSGIAKALIERMISMGDLPKNFMALRKPVRA
jgi:SNF2 family DNA or RNA helicase